MRELESKVVLLTLNRVDP